MKKSGLADSPFFAPSKQVGVNYGSSVPLEPGKGKVISSEQEISSLNESRVDNERSFVRSDERILQRTVKRSDEQVSQQPKAKRETKPRYKIRHTFDIFEDQLHALQVLQLQAVRKGRNKPRLGDMVQEAIDLFLESKGKKLLNRTNVRSDEFDEFDK